MTREEKRALWRERIEVYQSSGLTAAEWCRENEVNLHTFKTLITRLNMAQRPAKKKNPKKTNENIQWVVDKGQDIGYTSNQLLEKACVLKICSVQDIGNSFNVKLGSTHRFQFVECLNHL